MEIVLYLYSFIIGICVASFVNVVVWRLPQQLNFVTGRSFCPACKHTLAWYDLIPIISWLSLKGKCRYCHDAISIRYPLVEFIGGWIGVWCFACFGLKLETLFVFVFMMILFTISLIDWDTLTIPNGLQMALCIPLFALVMYHLELSWMSRILGAFIIAGPMFFLTLLIPDCFGGGDIKLMFLCGFLLGWKGILLAMFIAVLIAGTYAIYLLATKRAERSSHIAFGPYLCIGIAISICYGNAIVAWYGSLLL